MSHRVWSAIVMTRWSSSLLVSCRKCGVKQQSLSTLSSAVLGWWGFPWGLIMTPVQVIRNLAGLTSSHDPARPSPQLVQHSRLILADAMLRQQ